MDYLRSYPSLIDQSRFYFPPSLASAVSRGNLAEQRPSSVTADVLAAAAPPAGLSAAALTPLMMLHSNVIHDGLARTEREIPLDLSLKTIRQTPDSTADDDVITQQRVAAVNARNHALQMAAVLASGKFPFVPLNVNTNGPSRQQPFLPFHAGHLLAPPPPPLLIRPLASVNSTSASSSMSSNTTAASSVTSAFTRASTYSESGPGSAFVAPSSAGAMHSGVCGGLNGFCLDPRRCRLAAVTNGGANNDLSQMTSAFQAYATAMYERSKLLKSSVNAAATTTSSVTGVIPGLAEVHMTPAKELPSSSSSTTNSKSTPSSSTSTTTSSTALKTPFPVAIADAFYHPTFSLPLTPYTIHQPHSNGEAYIHDSHSHHNHANRLSKDPNCACCSVGVAKPYSFSCLCCYPTTRTGFDASTTLFGCCPPTTTVPVLIPNAATYNGHSSAIESKVKSSKHHHHHNHHHSRHEKSAESSSTSSVTSSTKTDGKKVTNGEVAKEEKSRLSPAVSPSVKLSTTSSSAAEGGRWIPHLHSSHSDKSSRHDASRGTTTNKVFAPVVRIPPSPPDGVFQGPIKTPSPHSNSASAPSSSAINRPTAFTAVYPSRSSSRSVDVLTPTPRRQTSPLDVNVTASANVKVEVKDDERESSCSPPKMAKLMPSVKKELEEKLPKSNGQWVVMSPSSSSPLVNDTREKLVVNRIWEANYMADNVPVVLALTPIDVKAEPATAPSPAEGSQPTECEKADSSTSSSSTSSSIVDICDDGRKMMLTDTSSTVNVNGVIRPENGVSPVVLKANAVESERAGWKRAATEPASASSPAKKLKKKDVIVISMKDEHQVSTNLVMKSVKRKLDEPKLHSNGIADGHRSSPIISQQLPESKSVPASTFSEAQLSTNVNTVSVVTTCTSTAARYQQTNTQLDTVSQHGNEDDKNSILKLNVKVPTAFTAANNVVPVNAQCKVAEKSQDSCLTEEKLPIVGITLTKTAGESGLYKSSVLNSTNATSSVTTTTATTAANATTANDYNPAISATAAMLRRYYEDQKVRLQQAEEFNRLRFTKGSNPLTNTPPKDTMVSSFSTKSTTSVTFTSIISSPMVVESKPKAVVTVSATNAIPLTKLSSNVNNQSANVNACVFLTKSKQQLEIVDKISAVVDDADDEDEDDEEDEDDDDDYEDEEDDDDDDDYSDDTCRSGKAGNKDGESSSGRKRTAVTNGNVERLRVPSKTNNHLSIGAESGDHNKASINSNSPGTTNVSHKSDNNSKRVMYNKALGETMLHRAARLGQLDHLKYYLETQSSTIDAKDNAGYTPLHECCSRGHIEAAKMLLQHGADVNSSAAGGVRPIHDAVENDHLEMVRLLLSYGADPLIATYSGQTPSKLARSSAMLEFFKGFLADVTGESNTPILPWQFRGSTRSLDVKPSGYDPLEDLPSEDEDLSHHPNASGDDGDVDDDAALIFEVSDKPHIPTYHVPATRRNGSGTLSFCLLQDVLNQTGMDRNAFLSCYPEIQVERMARQDFINQAKCTQIMVDPSTALKSSLPSSSSYIELVHWDSNLRDILDIERVTIPATDYKSLKTTQTTKKQS